VYGSLTVRREAAAICARNGPATLSNSLFPLSSSPCHALLAVAGGQQPGTAPRAAAAGPAHATADRTPLRAWRRVATSTWST